MTDPIEDLAVLLLAARAGAAPIETLPANAGPQTVAEAYAIQDRQFAQMGGEAIAWKVGPGGPDGNPTCAPIPASLVHEMPVTLASAEFRNFIVECELAFRLATDLPAREAACTPGEVWAAMRALLVTVEVVESRYAAWPDIDPHAALADFQNNGALVLGADLVLPPREALADRRVILTIDGVTRVDRTGNFAADPMELIAWLAGHVPQRSPVIAERRLKAGDVITTGSWTGIEPAGPGSTIAVEFPGLGEIEMGFS